MTVPNPMAIVWITMIGAERNHRSTVGQGNPVIGRVIRTEVADTPGTISGHRPKQPGVEEALMVKMKNIGLRTISSVASTSRPTK